LVNFAWLLLFFAALDEDDYYAAMVDAGYNATSPAPGDISAAVSEPYRTDKNGRALPKNWISDVDPNSGHIYYFNTVTEESRWSHPNDPTYDDDEEQEEQPTAEAGNPASVDVTRSPEIEAKGGGVGSSSVEENVSASAGGSVQPGRDSLKYLLLLPIFNVVSCFNRRAS
jgi:hypothetical protein